MAGRIKRRPKAKPPKAKPRTPPRPAGKQARQSLYAAPSLTLLIHGTDYPIGPYPPWVEDLPLTLHRALANRGHNVLAFHWDSGTLSDTEEQHHQQRVAAASELVRVFGNMQIGVLRIITHSHGATVASIATRDEYFAASAIKPKTFVMLSPAVSPTEQHHGVIYWPNLANIGDGRFYNFHLERDPILGTDWAVNYDGTPLDADEYESSFNRVNHWHTTRPLVWNVNGWYSIVAGP